MEFRQLGRTGLKVSAIGLGGNTFGVTADADTSIAVIQAAIDGGVTFLDTADAYGQGKSEEILGRAIAGHRHDVVLATKVSAAMGKSPYRVGLSRRWIMRGVEDSLQRLNTDYIDLYQAHWPDAGTPLEETLRAMDDLVHQGKVRYVGCSNYDAWEVAHAVGISRANGLNVWISAQNRWNLIEGLSDPTLLPAVRELGMSLIPYTPLAAGILTGKYRRGEEPPPGTRLNSMARLRSRLTDQAQDVVDRLRPWAEQRGHTIAQLAIAALLAYPEVGTVIVGARNPEQVAANLKAGEWTLTPEERDEVVALAKGSAD